MGFAANLAYVACCLAYGKEYGNDLDDGSKDPASYDTCSRTPRSERRFYGRGFCNGEIGTRSQRSQLAVRAHILSLHFTMHLYIGKP